MRQVFRWLLASASIVTIAWAFFDVSQRAWRQHVAQRERPITLTILHWGGKDEDQARALGDGVRRLPRLRGHGSFVSIVVSAVHWRGRRRGARR